jgi:hypothetical protein
MVNHIHIHLKINDIFKKYWRLGWLESFRSRTSSYFANSFRLNSVFES